MVKEIMKVGKKGLDFIANEEGCVLHPYRDSAGIPTISIGVTYYPGGRKVTMQDPAITKAQAYTLFKTILTTYEKCVWSVTRDDINQSQFDALTSLCYNIGVNGFKGSTLLKRVNNNKQDVEGITAAFLMWKNAGGKPVLLSRRKREALLYFS